MGATTGLGYRTVKVSRNCLTLMVMTMWERLLVYRTVNVRGTCLKLMVMTMWERLLVAFMLVEAVVRFTTPSSIRRSISA